MPLLSLEMKPFLKLAGVLSHHIVDARQSTIILDCLSGDSSADDLFTRIPLASAAITCNTPDQYVLHTYIKYKYCSNYNKALITYYLEFLIIHFI